MWYHLMFLNMYASCNVQIREQMSDFTFITFLVKQPKSILLLKKKYSKLSLSIATLLYNGNTRTFFPKHNLNDCITIY